MIRSLSAWNFCRVPGVLPLLGGNNRPLQRLPEHPARHFKLDSAFLAVEVGEVVRALRLEFPLRGTRQRLVQYRPSVFRVATSRSGKHTTDFDKPFLAETIS